VRDPFKDEPRAAGPAAADSSGAPVSRVWRRGPAAREDPWHAVRREIDRSRRHRHPFVLVRLPVPRRGRAARRALTAGVTLLHTTLRSGDSVWAEGDAVYLLLPETDRDGATRLLDRLGDEAPAVVPGHEAVRMACFPQDGLTVNAIRAAVTRDLSAPRALAQGVSAGGTESVAGAPIVATPDLTSMPHGEERAG